MASKTARSTKKAATRRRASKPRCAPATIPVTRRWAARFARAERFRLGDYGN